MPTGGDITITVLIFGKLKERLGTSRELLELRSSAQVRDVLEHYDSKVPSFREWRPSLAIAVNQQYATPETELKTGDEVALLPPVSGGAPEAAKSEPGIAAHAESNLASGHARIVRDAIDSRAIVSRLKRGDDGAVVVFEGTVRNQTRGRQTLYLDYEAYEAMALREMESLAERALAQFQIRDVALVHRLGRLEIGDTSVLVAVVSAHRAAAFEACRWLIDTLKRTVPIWKKEHFTGGAVWADGEPFPAEIPRADSTTHSPLKSPAQGSPAAGEASK